MYPANRNEQPYAHLELKNLPRLPIPALQATAKRTLEYLKPLLTSTEEEQRLQRLIAEFLQAGGEGEALVRRHVCLSCVCSMVFLPSTDWGS